MEGTTLSCTDSKLGELTITLDPAKTHAGTLLPLNKYNLFPAINRNVYYFVLKSDLLGDLISETPAAVESLIFEVPPKIRYEFKNAPLNFQRRDDPDRNVVAIIEKAVTDVQPA